jgi:hypothetical protein
LSQSSTTFPFKRVTGKSHQLSAATSDKYFQVNPTAKFFAKPNSSSKLKENLEVDEYLSLLGIPCLNGEVKAAFIGVTTDKNAIFALQPLNMKPLLSILFPVLLLTISTTGQTHNVTEWIKKKTIDGKEITMLRVPDTQFGAKLVGFISDAQYLLGKLPDYYNLSSSYDRVDLYGNIERDCQSIEKEDPLFPVQYYRDEMKAFRDLKEEMALKALAQKKADEDKAFFTRLKSDYAWISGDSLNVRTKPDAKSPSIGKILRLSYIRAYEVDNQTDWAEINFGEHSGYVLREHVAADWEELAPSHEDSAKLENGQHYYFTPTAAYTAQLKRAAAEEERAMRAANAAPARKYYRGPRGGCYYINAKGNKQYVDHSYCK